MKRMAMLVVLCVITVLSASRNTEAQRKKKGKEPELAICKRGKLVFEDDFSGKEFTWSFDSGNCQWKVAKGSLTTKSPGVGGQVSIQAAFASLKDFVLECAMWVPMNSTCFFNLGGIGGATRPYGQVVQSGNSLRLAIVTYYPGVEIKEHVVSVMRYNKPIWLKFAFEKLAARYVLTVGEKAVTFDLPEPDETGKSALVFTKHGQTTDVFAIDDVKVYEALPKDEGEDKDEKGKKGK